MSLFAPVLLLVTAQAVAPAAEALPRPPHQLVLVDGRRLPLLEAPRWAFGRATVTVAGGKRLQLDWRQVDHEATRRANPELEPPAPAKVWTEADLARIRRERLNVTGASAEKDWPGEAPPGGQTRTLAKKGKAGEAEWRGRAQPLREEIAQLETRLEYLERAREKWEAFTLGTGDYQAAAAQELGKIRRAKDSAEARLQTARGNWSRLEEEARTTGALPGWLR